MKKTFLGIGVGPGNGLSTAIRFAKEGFHPILASRDTSKLEALAEEVLQASGQRAEIVKLDAGDTTQISSLAERLAGNVNVLHYNAAIVHAQSLSDMTYDSMSEDIKVGIIGALAAIKAFSPAMIQRKQGTILLTGGHLALTPWPEYLSLGVAKAGIRNISQALFAELAEHDVHIASLTIAKVIAPRSEDADKVAETFWNIHNQPKERWTWEENYA
jgi:short-subunit dehydrogenase